MKKIPFNISYRNKIESGKVQVVTRNDKPVRIVCWNAKGDNPIIGLVTEKSGNELCYSFDINGISCEELISDSDALFILTEESHKLTDFEETLKGIVNRFGGDVMTEEGAKNSGARLFEVARKQFEKDIPKWRKVAEVHSFDEGISIRNTPDGDVLVLNTDGNKYFLNINELEKLPKED